MQLFQIFRERKLHSRFSKITAGTSDLVVEKRLGKPVEAAICTVPMGSFWGEQDAFWVKIAEGEQYLEWVYFSKSKDLMVWFAKVDDSWTVAMRLAMPKQLGRRRQDGTDTKAVFVSRKSPDGLLI